MQAGRDLLGRCVRGRDGVRDRDQGTGRKGRLRWCGGGRQAERRAQADRDRQEDGDACTGRGAAEPERSDPAGGDAIQQRHGAGEYLLAPAGRRRLPADVPGGGEGIVPSVNPVDPGCGLGKRGPMPEARAPSRSPPRRPKPASRSSWEASPKSPVGGPRGRSPPGCRHATSERFRGRNAAHSSAGERASTPLGSASADRSDPHPAAVRHRVSSLGASNEYLASVKDGKPAFVDNPTDVTRMHVRHYGLSKPWLEESLTAGIPRRSGRRSARRTRSCCSSQSDMRRPEPGWGRSPNRIPDPASRS